MSIPKLLTFVAVAAFTASALHGERRCPGNVPSVSLRQVQGAVNVVSVTVNGSGPFDFLVDTGAQTTTVDEELASQLRLQGEGKTHVSGAATYATRSYTHLAQVEIGDRQVTDVLALIDSLAELHGADRRIRGIIGENFLTHFDLLIDNEHHALCLDGTGAMAAEIKGNHVPLAQPYGTDHDLPFTRPLVIETRLDGIREPVLFRLDSGTNVPMIYGWGRQSLQPAQTNVQILKRFVDGEEQDFAVLPPKDVSVGHDTIRHVTFVQPMNSVGAVHQAREDGVLSTQMFRRVFVSYANQFAIVEPR
jgi:predicted aspartyl protease